MKNIMALLCFALTGLANSQTYAQAQTSPWIKSWTATVRAVGEDGNPIAGANASFQYTVPTPQGSDAPTYGEIKGLTDDNGTFAGSHTDSSFDLGVMVEKPGYYPTHIGHQFYFPGQFDEKTVTASLNPAFTLTLKKIGKPIAMYAKQIDSIKIPILNKPVGYDLMAGDWVAPYGKGANADFLFAETRSNSQSGYSFTISFSHPADGIQGFTRDWDHGVSGLLSSHEAPTDGYISQYVKTGMPNPDRIYYFRIRTVLDSQGHVLSALYGKIYGDFMQFNYYLNPVPNDRNIEFDMGQNLLAGLESFEQVRHP